MIPDIRTLEGRTPCPACNGHGRYVRYVGGQDRMREEECAWCNGVGAILPERPRMVCLCGSTRFGEAFRDVMRAETLAGKIVLTVGLLGHAEGIDMDGPVKAMLDELHLRKIDRADEVLILNVGGYVGASTARELSYARANGKIVRFLEPPGPESSS